MTEITQEMEVGPGRPDLFCSITYNTSNGLLLWVKNSHDPQSVAAPVGYETVAIDFNGDHPDMPNDGYFDLEAGLYVAFSEAQRWEFNHMVITGKSWDYASKGFVETERALEALRVSAAEEINRRRRRCILEPIIFEGITLDADQRSQDNINAKLNEIAARRSINMDMPAEYLVWRDFDNQDHIFETADAMELWLKRLLIAITERGARAYAESWAQKAAIDAIGTTDELRVYMDDLENK